MSSGLLISRATPPTEPCGDQQSASYVATIDQQHNATVIGGLGAPVVQSFKSFPVTGIAWITSHNREKLSPGYHMLRKTTAMLTVRESITIARLARAPIIFEPLD